MTSEQINEVLFIKGARSLLRERLKAGDESAREKLAKLPTVEDLAEKFGTSTQAVCRARARP